jgi:hypothetical protein
LIEGLQSIGSVGQSLYDTKKRVANAMVIKQALFPDMDPNVAKNADPDTLLGIAKVQKGSIDLQTLLNNLRPPVSGGTATTVPAPVTPVAPVATPIQPGASLPIDHSADLASISPTIPVPAPTVTPPEIPFGGASTQTAPASMPVPISAPPLKHPMINPATFNAAIKLGLLGQPNEKVMSTQDALDAGSVPKGTIIRDLPKTGGSKDIMDPQYQGKLEKQYADMRLKALSNRSGGLGLQDSKVNQAYDLRTLVNKYYDPKTDTFNIPPSQHAELALGLARLVSTNGQVPIELMHELRQSTGREALTKALIYAGADPTQVGGPTQSVARLFVDSIDRQGATAEQLRDQYMSYIHDNAPVDLDPARVAKHDKGHLNSFNEFLAKSPDQLRQSAPIGNGSWDESKESRYQELLKKHGSK